MEITLPLKKESTPRPIAFLSYLNQIRMALTPVSTLITVVLILGVSLVTFAVSLVYRTEW